mgnify:CR=1 FL=1
MKHAYLIMAHNSSDVLQRLISAIDDVRNDIFIHIDKKATFDGNGLFVNQSRLYIIPERIDARWGDFSLVEIELCLIREAMSKCDYSYLHLLSGVDYPIQSQDYIHQYCKEHQGMEFIGFAQDVTEQELWWRSQHYFLFSRDFQSGNMIKKILRALYARLQSVCRYHRTRLEVKKGAQWVSVTADFCNYVLSQQGRLRKEFNHTYCPDELVMQTLCWNSDFRNKVYSLTDEFMGCKRYIPWKNGQLMPFDKEDFRKMEESECWFARKFTCEDINTWESL